MTLVLGLTGPIGCGKSTVAGWLAELGAVVVDADQVANEVTAPGTPALAAISAAFGRGVLRPDGALDRSALGRIVFDDAAKLGELEAIVHPAVRPVILERVAGARAARAPAVVVEAIKLVEGGLAQLCDAVWLIVCDPRVQRVRLGARGQIDAERRITAQGDLRSRLAAAATEVIDTSTDVTATRATVGAALQRLLDGQ